ncbi:MAG: hypothetical protein JRN55_03895, partial [Nitrososphaerota archaeon]|nr:hypothetical protein [Nitrososphaerota archaeon]
DPGEQDRHRCQGGLLPRLGGPHHQGGARQEARGDQGALQGAAAAASVVAKVERDRQVALLKEAHGDFGSGYPSDPATKSFFAEWLRREAALPDFVRKSWKSWSRYARLPGASSGR